MHLLQGRTAKGWVGRTQGPWIWRHCGFKDNQTHCFVGGVCVTLELQSEPPVQKQLLFCFRLRDLSPKEEGRGGVLFHGLDMLSSFLLPRGSQRTLWTTRGSLEFGSITSFMIKESSLWQPFLSARGSVKQLSSGVYPLRCAENTFASHLDPETAEGSRNWWVCFKTARDL